MLAKRGSSSLQHFLSIQANLEEVVGTAVRTIPPQMLQDLCSKISESVC